MKVPGNNRWTQTNQGELMGIIGESFNMTFDKPGVAKLSKKPFVVYSSLDDADLGYIQDISYYDDSYIVATDEKIFQFDLNGTTVVKLTGSPTLSINSDAQVCYGRYYVTTEDNLYYWNGTSWSTARESLTADVPHPMAVFDSFTTYKLAIGDGNTVTLLSDAEVASGTDLVLPNQYIVTTIKYRNGYLYIGTKNTNGGEAKVFIWDGNTANANYEVPVGSHYVYSLTEYGNTVACITDQGQLLLIVGTQAQELAALPVYYDPNAQWQIANSFPGVAHEGMKTVGDKIYINVDGDLASGFVPEMKSGIWVFDPKVGLYPMAGYSLDEKVIDNSISVTDSVITTSAAHNLKNGDTVMFITTSGLSGVDDDVKYYVSVQSTTTIKLALSHKALEANKFVSITGTPNSLDKLAYVPNTEWGVEEGNANGAIGLVVPLSIHLDMWSSPIIYGGRSDTKTGTTVYAVFGLTESWNIGRITTQKMFTTNIIETWKSVVGFVKGVFLSNEEAILKYKSEDKPGYPTDTLRGVWVETDQINSNSNFFDEDAWSDIEVDDELTITDGYGRGYTTHVLKINKSTNTYTLTVDESIGTINGNVYFYADNFKKVQSLGNTRELIGLLQWAWTAVKSPWLKLKVELRGFNTEFYMFDVENGADK